MPFMGRPGGVSEIPNNVKLGEMVKNGETWWKMVKLGETWWKMVKNGETWWNLEKSCFTKFRQGSPFFHHFFSKFRQVSSFFHQVSPSFAIFHHFHHFYIIWGFGNGRRGPPSRFKSVKCGGWFALGCCPYCWFALGCCLPGITREIRANHRQPIAVFAAPHFEP